MSDYQHYSIFGESWWLDAVAGPDNWDEVRVESGGQLQARLPYYFRKRYGRIVLGTPPLTQHLGPWFAPSNAKYNKQLAKQKDLVEELIAKLPKQYDVFRQIFHHSVTNFLPWYWQGFEQITRYTYILEDLGSEQSLWDNLETKIRTDIRKAQNRFGLQVRSDLGPEVLLSIIKKTYMRQGKHGLSETLVHSIYNACEKRGAGRAFFAVDDKGQVHAAVYLVWDKRTAYYLIGGGDPELRKSGAQSLLLWEAIKFASTVSERFDFEGSMVESIERFFRAFGAKQVPYHKVTKINSNWLKAGWLMKDALKTVVRGA